MEFVREIDTPKSKKSTLSYSRLNQWRDAWSVCFDYVDLFTATEFEKFHQIFEIWVPILNRTFGSPIDLDRYEFSFYLCNQPKGPKEVLHLYCEDNPTEEGKTCVYVVFNLFKFRETLRKYSLNYSQNNQLLVDEGRGSINFAGSSTIACRPAYHFESLHTWLAFFAYTLHALAHLDTFDRYDTCNYHSHSHVRDSVFFKVHFFGSVNVKC